jgi:hypothetical protein
MGQSMRVRWSLAWLCAFLLQSAPGHAQSPIPFGTRTSVALGLAGCRNLQTMNRMAELILQNDVQAAVALTIREGRMCRLFEPGMQVIVEGFSAPHSLVCIRLGGDPDCYWFPSNYLRQ